MTLSDLDLGNLLQSQYDGEDIFDYKNRIKDVSFAIKKYPDSIVILFEGTYNLPDWISNFQANMVDVPLMGRVENGFYDGLSDVLKVVLSYITEGIQVYVTGHSRGAAHANLFSVMLVNAGVQNSIKRVTFASPRCGDEEFGGRLSKITGYNYRNFHDIEHQDFVCDVPFHFGLLPYSRPEPTKFIDVPPLPNDPWLVFARHHLKLYLEKADK